MLFIVFLLNFKSSAQNGQLIDIKDISKHNGDSVTVKGNVVRVIDGPLNHTYLLAFGKDFPQPAIKIWIVNLSDFEYYPTVLPDAGKVSFTGKLENESGQMWMMVYSSKQVKLTRQQGLLIIKPSNTSRKRLDSLVKALSKP